MKRQIIIYFAMLIYSYSFSQTIEFSGSITQNTVWDSDTLKITGNVTVNSGATLTIKAGTFIQFQGNYMISSLGRIIANGEKEKNIVFTINDTTGYSKNRSNVGWSGIKLLYPWDGGNYGNTNPNDSSIFNYCKIEYSRKGALIIANFSRVRISNSNFINNYGSDGAGINIKMSNPLIIGCNFTNNYSTNSGGAIYHTDNLYPLPAHYPRIINSTFIHNYGSQGGAINYLGYMYLVGNIFSHNSSYNGGAINFSGIDGIMANNIICNNNAAYGGGAIYGGGNNTDLLIANNTICNNKSEYAPGIYLDSDNCEFINNIVWNNKATRQDSLQIYLFLNDTKINVFNCLIEDYANYNSTAFTKDVNNLTGNPSFYNPTDSLIFVQAEIFKNWTLDSTSICIDKGTNVYNNYTNFSLLYDISGNNRKSNDNLDIGALEYQKSINTAVSPLHISNQIDIYPNPSKGIINIKLNDTGTEFSRIPVRIYNNTGKLVYCNDASKSAVEKIDISASKGINVIEVILDGNILTKKIIIE
jgi:predicted outer membrane repeat protein